MASALPSAATSTDPNSQPSAAWEGDKMFNIYIYDYCYKRGFYKTAKELLAEAEIPPESTPPINAKQGLLFEWWSVFWVLFSAKSNGHGPSDAMVYTTYQQKQQQVQQQAQHRAGGLGAPQGSAGASRFINGVPQRPMVNGTLANGIDPTAPLPNQQQQPPMIPGGQPPNFQLPQPNGVSSIGPPPMPGLAPGQHPNFSQLQPGPRPPPAGLPRPQNNGIPPFQSPNPPHNSINGPQHSQPPMNQLGPSPHMQPMNRGPMLPPGAQGAIQNTSMMGGQPGGPGPQFPPQVGRPPSRSGTPGQQQQQHPGMTQPSPSFAARQIQQQGAGGLIMPLQGDPRQIDINSELARIPAQQIPSIKVELGLGEKDLNAYTPDEKIRIINHYRARINRGNLGPPIPNAQAGPSKVNSQPGQRMQQQQAPPPRGNKRSSTSPAEEHELPPKNEPSPPDRKRPRISPMNPENPLTPTFPQPGPQGGPQQMQINGMMRPMNGGQPMNFPQQQQPPPGMGPNPGMPMQLVGSPMGNAMSPGMSHAVNPMMQQMPHQLQREQGNQQFRQPMQPGPGQQPPQKSFPVLNSALSPPDPSFNPGNRGKPMAMLPPQSPSLNGTTKDQGKDGKNQPNGVDGSPRNQPMGHPGSNGVGPSPQQGGTAPPTPVPGPMQQDNSNGLMNPSTPLMNNMQVEMSQSLFGPEFIASVASGFDDNNYDMFNSANQGIDFERDFGQWFNPNDPDGGSLDGLK